MGQRATHPARWGLGRRGVPLLGGLLLLGVVACASAATSTSPPPTTATPSSILTTLATPAVAPGTEPPFGGTSTPSPPSPVQGAPPVDTSVHSVPLEDIVFDTFGALSGNVPLDRASEDLILDLRDAIVPSPNRPTALPTPCPGWRMTTS